MASEAIILRRGFGSVAVDLQNLGVTIDSGDAYMAAKRWENAVQAYQAIIPQVATIKAQVTSWPPEIDGVLPQLQALDWHLASPQTAHTAQDLAKLIQADLRAPVASAPAQAPVKASSSSGSGSNAAVIALWGAVAVGLGVMGYLIFRGPKENPTGSGGKYRRGGSKLIAKGRSCLFEMADGSEVRCKGGMLHDPSGRWWPSKSVLIGPFKARMRRAADDELTDDAKDYLGPGYAASIGSVNTPPKPLSEWAYLGEVEEVYYVRTGRRHTGLFRHEFNKGLQAMLRGRGKVRLYRRGQFCRLELPRGAQLDSRGYVWP